jgi:hypothetical protein
MRNKQLEAKTWTVSRKKMKEEKEKGTWSLEKIRLRENELCTSSPSITCVSVSVLKVAS